MRRLRKLLYTTLPFTFTRNRGVSPEGGGRSLRWERFVEREAFKPGVNSEGMINSETGESAGEDEVTDTGADSSGSRLSLLAQGCLSEAGS